MAMTRSYSKLIDFEISTRTLELADGPPFCTEGSLYAGKQSTAPGLEAVPGCQEIHYQVCLTMNGAINDCFIRSRPCPKKTSASSSSIHLPFLPQRPMPVNVTPEHPISKPVKRADQQPEIWAECHLQRKKKHLQLPLSTHIGPAPPKPRPKSSPDSRSTRPMPSSRCRLQRMRTAQPTLCQRLSATNARKTEEREG